MGSYVKTQNKQNQEFSSLSQPTSLFLAAGCWDGTLCPDMYTRDLPQSSPNLLPLPTPSSFLSHHHHRRRLRRLHTPFTQCLHNTNHTLGTPLSTDPFIPNQSTKYTHLTSLFLVIFLSQQTPQKRQSVEFLSGIIVEIYDEYELKFVCESSYAYNYEMKEREICESQSFVSQKKNF